MPKSKLHQIIGKIVNTYDSEDGINHIEGANLPSRDRVVEIVVNFLNILFQVEASQRAAEPILQHVTVANAKHRSLTS